MNYLAIENLTLHYGDKIIFEDINFYINKGDKVALVAKNGTGKTTLLKMIFGEELPNQDAKFSIHSDVKVGYLKQDTPLDETKTIKEVLFSQNLEKERLTKEKAVEEFRKNEGVIAVHGAAGSPGDDARPAVVIDAAADDIYIFQARVCQAG